MTVGERLRKARTKLKKRQADIADEVGVSQPAVQAWESDHCLPETEKFRAVADAYGIDVMHLLPVTKKKAAKKRAAA